MLDRTKVVVPSCEAADDTPLEGVCKHCGSLTLVGADYCGFDCHIKALGAEQERRFAELEARLEERFTARIAKLETELREWVTGGLNELRQRGLNLVSGLGWVTDNEVIELEQRRYEEHQRRLHEHMLYIERQQQYAQNLYQPHGIPHCIPSRGDYLSLAAMQQNDQLRRLHNRLAGVVAGAQAMRIGVETRSGGTTEVPTGVETASPAPTETPTAPVAAEVTSLETDSYSWTGRMGG